MSLKIKNLRVGVIVSETDPLIVMCIDGTFRFVESEIYPSSSVGEIIFFEDSPTDDAVFVVPISEFKYYSNCRSYDQDYDETLRKDQNGLCVPKKILNESSKFIVDNGNGYQFIVYYQNEDDTYADWRYTESERELIRTFFCKPSEANINDILIDIDEYLNSTDFVSLIESFTINNEERFICRPGKEDYYYIDKVSMSFDDKYIESLFPVISENIHEDSGFCSAYSMRIHPIDREYMKEEKKLISIAKHKYNKDEHRRFLINNRINSLLLDHEKKNQNDLSIYKSFFRETYNLIENPDINIEFCCKHNELLRSTYKIANNGYEIDWHNFYNHITR